MKPKVLIIEDDHIMRVTLEDSLKANGLSITSVDKGIDGIEAFKNDDFSLVITDVRLPDMKGLDVLKKVNEYGVNTPVIIITAFGTIYDAVEAMKLGAYDYITKPFSLEEFNLIIERALEVKELKEENTRLKKNLTDCYSFPTLIGQSAGIKDVYELIKKVSQIDSTVLILGENGTGKELVSSAIHYQSKRKFKPYIKVNCAALPEHLVESELFGYEKGAFTGAENRKPGRFELADTGTIFLDEIGDLPPTTQIKLLRVLQDGSLERLGATESHIVNVRVIAATNKILKEEVDNSNFRADLYYRLNVIPINIPPLRDRKDDIPLLIDHFLDLYNCSFDKKITFSSDAINTLMGYGFPGNVRELENIVERCVALSNDAVVTPGALPSYIIEQTQPYTASSDTLSKIAATAEREHILRTLISTNQNKTRAAETLGISRKTLWEKMKTYKIENIPGNFNK